MLSPQKYLHLKLFTAHSRVLGLFDTSPHSNYKYCIDNLCTSVNFLTNALKHEAYIMIEKACHSGSCSFSNIAEQEEIRGDKNLHRVVGAVEEAELTAEALDDKIVARSIHNSKPVCFLGSSCEEMLWVKKTKKVWV